MEAEAPALPALLVLELHFVFPGAEDLYLLLQVVDALGVLDFADPAL